MYTQQNTTLFEGLEGLGAVFLCSIANALIGRASYFVDHQRLKLHEAVW